MPPAAGGMRRVRIGRNLGTTFRPHRHDLLASARVDTRYNGREACRLPPLQGMTQPIADGGTASARPGSALY